MNSKEKIHRLLRECCAELLAYVKEREPLNEDRWVPAAELKDNLDLNFVAVPKSGKQYGKKGWVFASLARMLEDDGCLEYKFAGNRAFYRSSQP